MGLIESMSCGIPVVTTKVGMSEDVINKNIPGEISDTFDPKMIANKVEETIDTFSKNENEYKRLIRKNIIKFDWREVAKQHWEKVYKNLV